MVDTVIVFSTRVSSSADGSANIFLNVSNDGGTNPLNRANEAESGIRCNRNGLA